jgi:hypothetical protein
MLETIIPSKRLFKVALDMRENIPIANSHQPAPPDIFILRLKGTCYEIFHCGVFEISTDPLGP